MFRILSSPWSGHGGPDCRGCELENRPIFINQEQQLAVENHDSSRGKMSQAHMDLGPKHAKTYYMYYVLVLLRYDWGILKHPDIINITLLVHYYIIITLSLPDYTILVLLLLLLLLKHP